MVFGCGLMTNQEEPVPLKSIEVGVQVKDHVATVSSTLQYENKEDRPLEAVFVFPLPGEAAVCHFSATVGQTEVVAKVQEKQKAREEYDDALSSGEQAFLLEESDQSPDVFTLSVGSLPPGESATIRLEYVTELAVQADDGLRLCLPAVLNPRYQPQGCDPGNAKVTSVPASAVPYSLSVSADISSPRLISKVESNCLLEPLKHLNKDQTHATVSLAAGHKFDRDFELLIYYKDSHLPSAVVEAAQTTAEPGTLMGDAVVMLSLYPEFPEEVMCGEFLFVIDRSGSMECQIGSGEGRQDRIGSARDTLLLLLKSLPMGCYFNIYGFGSTYDHIFPKSVEYSQKTMDDALTKVKNMSADLGGTEIMEPLKHIYSQPCLPSQPRQLFVFTDGKVWNTKEVLDLVRRNAGSHRCFTFGIGEGASSALINGMAKEGGGHAQFITGADRMQPKVMQSLRFALQPAVVNISVKWDVPRGVSVTSLSPPITTLFQGQRSLLYAQLTGNSSGDTEGSVTVKYSLAEQPFKNRLCFRLKPTDDTGLTVHRLGARTKIRSLEMEARETEGLKKKVVALSVQSGVSSTFTAFIAVNKGSGKVLQGPLVRRNIPTATDSSRRSYLISPTVISCSMASQPKMLRKGKKTTFSKRFQLLKVFRKKAVPVDMLYNEAQCVLPQEACLGIAAPSPSYSKDLCSKTPIDIDYASIECNGVDKDPVVSEPIVEPLLRLISLQKASGSWVLEPALAEALGKTSEEMAKPKPAQVNQEVWATVLALIWLHGFKMDAKDEWELLAMKAASWVQAQKVPNVTEFVEAGNTLLGCKVQRNTLGI